MDGNGEDGKAARNKRKKSAADDDNDDDDDGLAAPPWPKKSKSATSAAWGKPPSGDTAPRRTNGTTTSGWPAPPDSSARPPARPIGGFDNDNYDEDNESGNEDEHADGGGRAGAGGSAGAAAAGPRREARGPFPALPSDTRGASASQPPGGDERKTGGGGGGEEEDDEEDDDEALEEFGFRQDGLSEANSSEHEQLRILYDSFTPEQAKRFDHFRGSKFQPSSVRKLMQSVTNGNGNVSQTMTIAMSGIAKVFVGDLIETARCVMSELNESGPLRPRHIREACRRLNRSSATQHLASKKLPFHV